TLLRLSVNVGEVLGNNPQRPVILFCPAGPRIVRAEVEQEFAVKLVPGMSATIEDDATGGGKWKGKVARVSDWYSPRPAAVAEAREFNEIRTLEVILSVEEGKEPLRIGQRLRVIIHGIESPGG